MIKKVLFILILIVSSYGNEMKTLETNFQNMSLNIINIVQNKNTIQENRNEQIISAITPVFDFVLMAKLSLGKKWKTISKTTQASFVEAYVNRMKKTYSAKINNYTDEIIVINSTKQVKKTRAVLNSSLVKNDTKLDLIYKYYKPKKQQKDKFKWLVYDVVISGVSIIKTDKAQFKAMLKENSVEQLIEKLK